MSSNGTKTSPQASRIDDLTAYPILTESINGAGGGGGVLTSDAGAGSSNAIGQIVQSALRNVLAWKPKAGDPKAFLSALHQSFDLVTTEGHVDWKWIQRSYAIDADLGKVTGAQASIYARAKSFLDQVSPLIQGFVPLRPDFSPEEVEATRAVVTNGVNELVNELGQEGGPRISRVDQLFKLLLGPQGITINGDATQPLGLATAPADAMALTPRPADRPKYLLGGQLGQLRDKFGYTRLEVNTISDEETLTNFLILVDGVQALLYTWKTQRKSFERRGNDVFLGTQAVLLSRSLGVIAEAVQDAYVVMDSVFLGAAERQVTELHLDADPANTIFLADLLSWIEDFATNEGPLLINDGGLLGVRETFVPTVIELERLARRAAGVSRGQSNNPTPNYHTTRVAVAMEALAQQLGESMNLSVALRTNATRIHKVTPHESPDKAYIASFVVDGDNFKIGSTLRLDRSIARFDSIPDSALSVTNVNSRRITAVLDLSAGYGASTWDVVVIEPDGIEVVKPRAFTITPAGPIVGTINVPNGPVTSSTASVSVAATDGNGGPNITCDWILVSGPASASFLPRNAVLPDKSTVTFTLPGTYTIQAKVTDGITPVTSAPATIVVQQTAVSIQVQGPASALAPGQTAQLAVTGVDQFGVLFSVDPTSISLTAQLGSISSLVYTAPSQLTSQTVTDTVTATLPGIKPAKARIVITENQALTDVLVEIEKRVGNCVELRAVARDQFQKPMATQPTTFVWLRNHGKLEVDPSGNTATFHIPESPGSADHAVVSAIVIASNQTTPSNPVIIVYRPD